ncbi:MAG: hypothetical protein IJE05_04190 [Clostridia bacterium]|nr:hypothetical protein [Clostridia bacterium]
MKISKRRIGILIIFVIFILLLESISIATYQNAIQGEAERNSVEERIEESLEKNTTELTAEEQETLNLINQYRKKMGLSELKPFFELQEVSKLKAEDLVENEYFSHTSPNLGTPFEMLQQNGIDYIIAGENLAGNVSPEKAVEAWINSPSHRDNILEGKFQYTGISVVESPIYGKVFVQLFI